MNELVQQNEGRVTAADVKAGVQLIQQVMAAIMIKDVHYGTIPGTQKPTLYKPGSEVILTTFRIAAYPKEVDDLSTPDEARFRVKVHGISQTSGCLVGVGIGECSSKEAKYMWRAPVCDQEFEETPEDRKRTIWKKGNPPYQIKQIRTYPADVANTILKMAKKRAQIDMTLTATAASDVFDQDLEDLPDGMVGNGEEKKPPLKEPGKKPPTDKKQESKPGEVTTPVFNVEAKSGEKNGKAYTIYGITGDGDTIYKTFDSNFADLATTAKNQGIPVKINFTVGKYGNTITALTVIEEREAGQEG